MKLTALLVPVSLTFTALLVGCAPKADAPAPGTDGKPNVSTPGGALKGEIVIDGSSTVFPIAQAVAEDFKKANADVKISVSSSGTGGGFKKFSADETDISTASRPIETAEIEACKAKNIEFIELPVAYDGLSVVVNKANTWVDKLTVEELKKIWEPNSPIKTWDQVRAGFPKKPMKLYGPGADSGTFDYFTKAIVGKEKSSRNDYEASEDDNTLVTGVSGDEGAMGYFGFAYYIANQDKLKIVPIDAGKGPITPSMETVADGTYAPLSRPEFIYVKKSAAGRPEVKALVEFFLGQKGRELVKESGYTPLPDAAYDLGLKRFAEGKVGSVFSGAVTAGMKIEEIMSKEK